MVVSRSQSEAGLGAKGWPFPGLSRAALHMIVES